MCRCMEYSECNMVRAAHRRTTTKLHGPSKIHDGWNGKVKRGFDWVQGSGRVTAEDVQRLLGQAQQQIAQPGAWGSDGAAEDSEAARDGDQPGDRLDERIKRRCAGCCCCYGSKSHPRFSRVL